MVAMVAAGEEEGIEEGEEGEGKESTQGGPADGTRALNLYHMYLMG